jgi:hypothetical protein
MFVDPCIIVRCQVAYTTWQNPTTARPTTFHICKPTGCLCSFRLLMMGGVSPETCWISFKIRNNKNFDTHLHLVGFFCKNAQSVFSSLVKHQVSNGFFKIMLFISWNTKPVWHSYISLNTLQSFMFPCTSKFLILSIVWMM